MKKFTSILCALAIVLSASAAPLARKGAVEAQAASQLKAEKVGLLVKGGLQQGQAAVAKAPKAKKEEFNLTFSSETNSVKFTDACASEGWWQFTAETDEVFVSISNANRSVAAGEYAWEDLDGTWCYILDLATSTKTLFTDGSCVVSVEDNGDAAVVGTFKDANDNTYNIIISYTAPSLELVVLPENAEVVEYNMDFINPSSNTADEKTVNVAVVDDKVYFQGLSSVLPKAWVVGTKEGNAVTFEANQYVGEYGTYGSSFFFVNGKSIFTYDADADSYSLTGTIYGVLGSQYYDGRYTNPVLTKAPEIDLNDAEEVAITTANGSYDSYYGDIIYTLSNATEDSVFVFDIKLASGATDVTLDQAYTLDDMYSQATYTYAQIGGTKIGLKKVEFIKSKNAQGLAHIDVIVIDVNQKLYHLVYDFQASGEEVDLFLEAPMSVPQYYDDGSWEVYTKSVSGDTVVAFVYYSENATSPAGTFTESDLQLDYSGIVLDGANNLGIVSANITVTESEERIDVTAKVVAGNGITYNITMFFVKPVATAQETITSEDMTLDKSYFDWYGVVVFAASDENNAIELTVNVEGLGAALAGDYVAGTNFNGTITPAGGEEVEVYSGTITIAVDENTGDITLTGVLVATNNVEYTLNLKYIKPAPVEHNLTMTTLATTPGTGTIRYALSNDDYKFYFTIELEGEDTDIESGVTYTFADNMGSDTYSSFGLLLDGSYSYIDYADASFVKTATESEIRIEASITDVEGDTWNLLYTETVTAVDNINAEAKAVKRIENNMLIIEKSGVRYNVLGTVVK